MVIKRSFRFGLVVGLLAGLALALVKALGGRDDAPSRATPERRTGSPWPRLEHDPAVPARPRARLVADPDAPSPAPAPAATPVEAPAEPEATHVGASEEPPPAEPAPESKAAPERAPAEKAASKRTPAKKAPSKKAIAKTAPGADEAPEEAAREKAAPKKAASQKTSAKKAAGAKKATAKKKAPAKKAARAWVEPHGEVCPTSHPVKAKLASKIFHQPGGLSYTRTRPDRCYLDAAAAEADGLRPAKR